ncbi:hypothetical protein [Flavobacterium soyangense]|uniref:Uncharacterized protein n=1 Tax=Flavobacterium soyangense TaxID=2023265 RepID=A0A930U6I9_9FLAO|nr:hypothetical protein [Flavobacterium soyangense]MBF2707803.1 hypothetical protein [Flavobacterium soyangense]
MYNRRRTSRIFGQGRITDIFQNSLNTIKSIIENEKEDYILNVNITDYIEHFVSKYKLEIPEIHFEEVYADSYEDEVPAEYFPFNYNVYQGEVYKKEIIQFFIPCSGNVNLLNYTPASRYFIGSSGSNFEVRKDTIVTEFINFSNDADEINKQFKNEQNGIQNDYNSLKVDIENFNKILESETSSYISQRKHKLLSKNNLLSSLGVPLRKKDNVVSTFAVPKPLLREKIIVKPIVHEKGFKPEPTLDNENYQKILKLINDVGKNFERMPSLFKGKGEEDLRDHILMTLDPNFEFGSVSGETFNKTGKTDIQLRHDSSVIFIAECKFWSGEKNYLSTIDQLLGYLTWRDTKSSVILFVNQKDITAIIKKVETETSKHSNYLSFTNKSDENWFNFSFHINGDRNREVKLAVQLYHLPK